MQSAVCYSCQRVIVVSHTSADQDHRIRVQFGGVQAEVRGKVGIAVKLLDVMT
jgi:hypothetical protein